MTVRRIISISSLEELGLSEETLGAIKKREISAGQLVFYARNNELSTHFDSDSHCVEEVLNTLYREGFIFRESPKSRALRQAMVALGIIKEFGSTIEYESRHEFSDEDVDRLKDVLQDFYNETQGKNGEATPNLEEESLDDMKLVELDPTVRTANVLSRNGIETVGRLLTMTENDLICIPNLGRKCVDEIRSKLKSRGLSLREEP